MSVIDEGVKAIALSLIPPGDNASPRRIKTWRWTVAILTGVAALHVGIQIARAFGFMMFIGWSPYATADDLANALKTQNVILQQLQSNQNASDVRSLERDMRDTRIMQCNAIGEKNSTAMQFFDVQMGQLQNTYRSKVGFWWNVPDCISLVAQK